MHFPCRNIVGIILLLLGMLTLFSCRTQNLFDSRAVRQKTDSSFFASAASYQYQIRTGDKVTISLWNHDELSVGSLYGIYNSNEVYGKWLMVDANGEINIPKAGVFRVKGLTIIQAEDSLRRIYSEWIRNPVVDVKVLNKEVTMIGEWKNPGKLLLEKDENSLVELIGKAGDFDFYADKRRVKVIRMIGGQPRMLEIDLTRIDLYGSANINILPGDVVYVPAKKSKDFEKRVSTILPVISVITAFAIVYKAFF